MVLHGRVAVLHPIQKSARTLARETSLAPARLKLGHQIIEQAKVHLQDLLPDPRLFIFARCGSELVAQLQQTRRQAALFLSATRPMFTICSTQGEIMSERQASRSRHRARLVLWAALGLGIGVVLPGPAGQQAGLLAAAGLEAYSAHSLAAEGAGRHHLASYDSTLRGALRGFRAQETIRRFALETMDFIRAQQPLPKALDTSKLRRYRTRRDPLVGDRALACLAIRFLSDLAIDSDYAPAIRDLLVLSEDSELLVLMHEEEYYYLARALHLGLDVPALETRRTHLSRTLPEDVRAGLDAAGRRPERLRYLLPQWDCLDTSQSSTWPFRSNEGPPP